MSDRLLLNLDPNGRLAAVARQMESIAKAAPAPVRALAAADGDGFDEHVLLRGNHKTPGAVARRRFLQVLSPTNQSPVDSEGSGRLQLADRMTDPAANPLLARVMVNRVWHHLLGRGIVPSTDNFGYLGERPTHPELLDYLADQFIRDGWSTKRLIRRIVLCATYRMSSRSTDVAADEVEPGNALLHKARVRRLQGEAIRDALLAVAGELDSSTGGPGVEATGPAGHRRSVYLAVKRNAPVPILKVFDAPWPYYAMGRRDVSNVPAQALMLMNDPQVHALARSWAQQTLRFSPDASPRARIENMYERAFSRPPTSAELAAVEQFLAAQADDLGIPPAERVNSVTLWTDVAHALMNAKEFLFIE